MDKIKLVIAKVNKQPGLVLGLKMSAVFLPIFYVSAKRLDPDFGWHLQAGNYFLNNGVPEYDVFSYTAPGFRWINHEWGNDILVYLLHSTSGYVGLAFFFALLWTLAIFIAGHRARLLTLLLATTAMMPYLGVRATTWTVLFFSILLWICNSKRPRFKYFIPLLLLVWVNFHGGFVVGLAVTAYFAITKRSRGWFYVFGLSLAATIVNFYGINIYIEVFRTLTDTSVHSQISEWHRFYLLHNSLLYVCLWAAGFWLFDRKKPKKWFGLPPILLVASFLSTRHLPLFVISSISVLDDYISKFLSVSLPKQKRRKNKQIRGMFIFTILLAIIISMLYFNRFIYYLGDKEASYPKQATLFIEQNACTGSIFGAYDFGGYLIWKLPEYKVYIDGRMPVWKDDSGQRYFDNYKKVLESQEFREAEFEKFNVRCVILPLSKKTPPPAIHQELVDSGWQREGSVSDSVLLLAPVSQ